MFFYFIVGFNMFPLLYPCYKAYKRTDLNLFDFLMFFEAAFFLFIPAFKEIEPDGEVLFRYFIIYTSFNYLLLATSYLVERYGADSILNITGYLSKYKDFRLNLLGQILLFLSMIAIFMLYLPTQALVLRFEGVRGVQTYSQSTVYLLLGALYFVVRIIISLIIVSDFINHRKNIFNIVLFAFFVVLALLGVRRDLIFSLLVFLVILYAMRREFFNRKFIIVAASIGLFLLTVYFPFYNIIRISPVKFNPNSPIESVIEIADYGLENYDNKIDNASESTNKRSLGLYNAFYLAIEKQPDWQWGKVTAAFIDSAIPRFLHPGKGNRGGGMITRAIGVNTDIADSALLTGVCEFGIWGGVYAALLFLIVFMVYNFYAKLLTVHTSSLLISVYIMFSLFGMCWNVEVLITAFFSWFFSSIPIIFALYIIERFGIMEVEIKGYDELKDNELCIYSQ